MSVIFTLVLGCLATEGHPYECRGGCPDSSKPRCNACVPKIDDRLTRLYLPWYILDSCRAAVCYRNGVVPDATQFPKAAYLYTRASEILGSVLTDGMGRSDTFRMPCAMAGVQCSRVSCASRGGGAVEAIKDFDHSFNVAVPDGEVYYFDVYWDGAGTGYKEPPYTYFAMTEAEAAKSHTWLSYAAWGPPQAVSVRYQTDPATGERIHP